MHEVRPAHVHPFETLRAGVTEAADEQPGRVPGYDGHGVWPGGETPLVEPLAAPDTANHLLVPTAGPATVAVSVLQQQQQQSPGGNTGD